MAIPSKSVRDPIIVEAATELGVNPNWLDYIVKFESGYDPQAVNAASGARGLIQILDSTARDLFNMGNQELIAKYPDFESQMYNVVVPYFKRYAPFPTEQSFYMAVFFPLARDVPPDTTFKSLYQQNPSTGGLAIYEKFQKGNPGIITVADYVNRLFGRKTTGAGVITASASGGAPSNPRIPAPLLLAAAGTAAFLLWKHYGR